MTRSSPSTVSRISGPRLIAFSIAGLAIGGVQTAVVIYLPAFYAQQFGLRLGLVGAIFMACRLWNAFSDPAIGLLSDRTHSRFGQRKPWVVGGGALLLVSTWAIFMPPRDANVTYLAGWLLGLYLGLSALSTPLYAWAGNLSAHYHERTRNQTYLQTVVSMGLATMVALPLILDRVGYDSGSIKIAGMGWANIAALAVGIPILGFWFKEKPAAIGRKHVGVGAALRLLATDPIVLRVIGSDFFVSLGQGFRGSLLIFFIIAFMRLPSWAILVVPLVQYAFGVFAAPIWMQIGRRLGKHRTVIAAEIFQVAVNLGLLLLSPGRIWPLIGLTIAQGLSQGSGNLMLRAIVSDVADLERLKTGKDHSGLLFSIFNVTINAAMALSVGVALPLIGWFGFRPGMANSGEALNALRLTIAAGPAIGHALSALLMWRFPLDEKRHAEILDALRSEKTEAPPALQLGVLPAIDQQAMAGDV